MDKWTKKDFEIKSYRSGSQLKGRENEWLCKIVWNGKTLKDGFSNKSEANKWLSDFIRKRNEMVMKIKNKDEVLKMLDYSIDERIQMNIKDIKSHINKLNYKNENDITNLMYHTRLIKQACDNIIDIVIQEVK